MADMEYEYKSAKVWKVHEEYENGWEPVPNVPIVPWTNTTGGSDNWIQLRRPLLEDSQWDNWEYGRKRNAGRMD